jgi:hypothetical protein
MLLLLPIPDFDPRTAGGAARGDRPWVGFGHQLLVTTNPIPAMFELDEKLIIRDYSIPGHHHE